MSSPDRLHDTPGRFAVAVCPDCGGGRTLPYIAESELGTFYPDDYSPYAEVRGGVMRVISHVIRTLQGRRLLRKAPLVTLADQRPGRAVDVGCGRGDLAVMLTSLGWATTGIEPSAAACAVAAERGVDARCGTLQSVPLEQKAYDAAIFHHSLEHVPDPVEALRSARAALRPGGLVLVTVPNFGSWQARRFGGRWFHLDLPRHRAHLTARGLDRVLRAAELEPVELTTSSSAVGLPGSIQYRLLGRCAFRGALAFRATVGLCVLAVPLIAVTDRLAGAGDLLHAVAARPC